MKTTLLCFVVALAWAFPAAAQVKVKEKDGELVVRDKSKPVRRAIEAWYDANIAAFEAKDVARIMALRTDDFHTVTPDGRVNSRADMEARTRMFVGRIDRFLF